MKQQTPRGRLLCCIGCGLPLMGFQTEPYRDGYGDVYHSRACYVRCEMADGREPEVTQTPQQKLNSLYAQLGLNLRDNDPTSPEMQAEAMALISTLREHADRP